MTEPAASTAPALLATTPRVIGFDVARALAVLGMVLVNFDVVLSMGCEQPEFLRMLAHGCSGRAAATFVTLAGIGIVLIGKRPVLFKRALFLLVVGYAWQVMWPGDILHYYAFYLALGALCLPLSARVLAVLALAAVGGFMVLFALLEYGTGWNWLRLEYPAFWTWTGQLRNLFFNGFHPIFPWMAFAFLGMALGKLDLARAKVRRIAMVLAALLLAIAGVVSAWLTTLPDTQSLNQLAKWYRAPQAIWALGSIPPGPLYVLSAAASAVLVIGLCLELTAWPRLRRLAHPLAATGQLAFTLYLAHVVFLFFALEPLLEYWQGEYGLSSKASLSIVGVGTLVFGLGAILFATAWSAHFRRGPVEALMRRLTG